MKCRNEPAFGTNVQRASLRSAIRDASTPMIGSHLRQKSDRLRRHRTEGNDSGSVRQATLWIRSRDGGSGPARRQALTTHETRKRKEAGSSHAALKRRQNSSGYFDDRGSSDPPEAAIDRSAQQLVTKIGRVG